MAKAETKVWWIVFLLGVLVLSRYVYSPPQTMDYWFFLAKGERIAADGLKKLGGPNPFVFTAPKNSAFYDKEWLFEWGLFQWFKATGHAGAVILKGLVTLLLWLLFLLVCRRLGANPWHTLLVFLLGWSSVLLVRMSIRPHMLGYAFMMFLFWVLLRPPNKTVLIITGAMFVLWANVHGSFVMAGALLGVYGVWAIAAPAVLKNVAPEEAERAKKWRGWWTLLPVLPFLIFINPYGWRLWVVIWAFQKEVSGKPDPFVTAEWIPFSLSHPFGQALVCLIATTLLTWLLKDSRKTTERLGWILIVALLGYSNLRFVGLAFLLLGPLLAAQIQNFRSRKLQHIFVGGLFLLMCFFQFDSFRLAPANQLQPNLRKQPEEVLGPLLKHTNLKGRIFTNVHPTGYLAFRLSKSYQTSYDGHTITPGFTAWSQDYKKALLDPKYWDVYCRKHKCNLVILDMEDQKSMLIATHLYLHKDWVPIRMTLQWVLYARRTFAPQAFKSSYYEILRSFYSFDGITASKAKKKQRAKEMARLTKEPHSQPLAAALQAFLILHKQQALAFSPKRKNTVARAQQLKMAYQKMLHAYKDAPWHPGVNLTLAQAMSALKMKGAAKHFEKAALWNPIWLNPRVGLVRYWIRMGRTDLANKALRQLTRVPNGVPAWKRLEAILRKPATK